MASDSNCTPSIRSALRGIAATAVLATMCWISPTTAQEDGSKPLDSSQTAMPALPPAVIDEELAIGGEAIDARKLRSRMTVDVMVNETGPYRFVVDSGADTSVVGQRLAGTLQLPATDPAVLNTMTNSQVVDRVMVDELQLGPTTIRGLEVPVLNEFDIGAEGMIGLDALVEQRLMLDFEERVITVDDASSPAPRFDGEIVVTARLQRGQLILTEVLANKMPIEAVIDTGSEITIGNAALRKALVRRNPRSLSTIGITGVTGIEMDIQIAKIAEIRLGPVKLQNVAIAFADVPPFAVFGLDDEPALLLGTDLMEQFRKVSLDFHARKVRFQLQKCERNTVRIRTAPSYASRLSADRSSACSR